MAGGRTKSIETGKCIWAVLLAVGWSALWSGAARAADGSCGCVGGGVGWAGDDGGCI